ncbi:MAG TPA: hypothetical protein VIL05_12115 [Thermoclostridium sp.]
MALKRKLRFISIIIIVTMLFTYIPVYGAETGESDAGYSKKVIASGTWAIMNSQNTTGTRIYAVTLD